MDLLVGDILAIWLKPTSWAAFSRPCCGATGKGSSHLSSGRSQSPDCLSASVLTSWVTLLYISHALSILFTLFSPSAAHISFSPAWSLFGPPIPHHCICKWNVDYADFILCHRDFRFSYHPVRVNPCRPETNNKEFLAGFFFFVFSSLSKNLISTSRALYFVGPDHILQSLCIALNLWWQEVP